MTEPQDPDLDPASSGLRDLPDDPDESPSSLLRGATKTAALLTVAGLVGQVFALIRELYVADKVGVSQDLDALLVAAVAPTILASILASGASAAMVPSYLAVERDRGRQAADRLLGTTLTWIIIIGLILTVVIVAGAGVVIAIAGPGLDATAREVGISYVPIVAPMLVFACFGSMLAATFQVHDRMRAIAVAWLLGPVASVVVTIGLWDRVGLTALAVSMSVQQATIVIVMVIAAIRYGILPPISVRVDPQVSGPFVRHAAPLMISSSVLQFNLLTDRAIATLVTPGAVSALRYAEGVIRIPMNAIIPAWTAAIYPALVRASLLGASGSLGQTSASALRYVVVIFVPLSVATAALAPVIVDVAYVRGAFDERAATLTTAALAGFAPLLVLTMANAVLTGAHNARQRGIFLMQMGFLDASLNAVFNVGLGLLIGVAGIALSTSLTMGIVQFLKAWRLGALDRDFPLGAFMVVSARALAASLVVGLPIALLAWNAPHGIGTLPSLGILVVLSAVGMVAYIAVAWVIGLREPWTVARVLIHAPRRLRPG